VLQAAPSSERHILIRPCVHVLGLQLDGHVGCCYDCLLVCLLVWFFLQELRAKLLAEAEAAASANAAISSRWSGVLGHNVPQDMFMAIEQQRLACEGVIASKDRLIAGTLHGRCVAACSERDRVHAGCLAVS
jgi:hypothetical protein